MMSRNHKPGQLLYIEEGAVVLLGPWPVVDHSSVLAGYTEHVMFLPGNYLLFVEWAANPYTGEESMVVLYKEKLYLVQPDWFEAHERPSLSSRPPPGYRKTGFLIPWKVKAVNEQSC